EEARLTYENLVHCEEKLCVLTAEEVSRRYAIAPPRARILLAGALIIRTLMERLQLKEIRVSTHGIREGVLLARARYGEQWLAQLQQRAAAVEQKNVREEAGAEREQGGTRE